MSNFSVFQVKPIVPIMIFKEFQLYKNKISSAPWRRGLVEFCIIDPKATETIDRPFLSAASALDSLLSSALALTAAFVLAKLALRSVACRSASRCELLSTWGQFFESIPAVIYDSTLIWSNLSL
jgi:hypothetical protein